MLLISMDINREPKHLLVLGMATKEANPEPPISIQRKLL